MHKHYSSSGGGLLWVMFGITYILTSDTVAPYGKWEVFARLLLGPLNYLPFI